MKTAIHSAVVIALLATSATTHAETDPASGWNLSVGMASISMPAYLGDDANRSIIAPDIRVSYKDRFFASTLGGMGYNLVNQNGWLAGPIVKYNNGRQENGDDDFFLDNQRTNDLQGLGDIGSTAEAGGFVEFTNATINTRLEVRKGADGHQGTVGEASIQHTGSRALAGKAIFYSIGPQASIGNSEYLSAFFGVDEQQSISSGLSEYQIDGGLIAYGLHASLMLPVTDRVSVVGFGSFDQLAEEVADSSLVSTRGSDQQKSVGIFLNVSF